MLSCLYLFEVDRKFAKFVIAIIVNTFKVLEFKLH